METNMGTHEAIDRLRREKISAVAVSLASKMAEALMAQSRSQGLIVSPQIRKMCTDLARVCTDVVMKELAVVQTKCSVSPDDVPAELRGATTQAIIDQWVSPRMAEDMAGAMVKAGLVAPTLTIPTGGGVKAHFAAWGLVIRQPGPASMPNAPRLDYGRGTSVFPRIAMAGQSEGDLQSFMLLGSAENEGEPE